MPGFNGMKKFDYVSKTKTTSDYYSLYRIFAAELIVVIPWFFGGWTPEECQKNGTFG
mgnify:CR=1 FL=1